MKIGSIYRTKNVIVVWSDPGRLIMGKNEKAVITILNKDDIFVILDVNENEIEIQKFNNFKNDIITRGVAKIMTFNGINGWITTYNNWLDFDFIE